MTVIELLRPNRRHTPAPERTITRVGLQTEDAKSLGEWMTATVALGVAALLAILLVAGRTGLGDTIYTLLGWACVTLLVGLAAAHVISPRLPKPGDKL